MKEKIKSMNLIQIISNILMLITVIGSIFSKDNIAAISITNHNIEISKDAWDSYETSWDFKRHPLV